MRPGPFAGTFQHARGHGPAVVPGPTSENDEARG